MFLNNAVEDSTPLTIYIISTRFSLATTPETTERYNTRTLQGMRRTRGR
jgi:hypothetical protein